MKSPRRNVPVVDTREEQVARWLAGESVHVRTQRRGEVFECCPDFSCCDPKLLQPLEVRSKFVNADESGRVALLAFFLGAFCASMGIDVHVAGVIVNDNDNKR